VTHNVANTSADYWSGSRLNYWVSTCFLGLFADKTGTNRTVPDLGDLENYVYEVNGGEGIFVYHVEQVSASRVLYEVERSKWTFIGHQHAKDHRKSAKLP